MKPNLPPTPSFPRRRESKLWSLHAALANIERTWIPACAGMTVMLVFFRITKSSKGGYLEA